jgi:hypothetical protein
MKQILNPLLLCILLCSCMQSNPQDKNTAQESSNKPVYTQVSLYADGSKITDAKCDGIIYKKVGSKYYKRNYTGSIQANWFVSSKNTPYQNAIELKKLFSIPISNKTLNNKISLISGDFFANAIDVASGTHMISGTLKMDNSVISSNPDGANILKITTNNNVFTDVVFDANQFLYKSNIATRCVNLAGENNTFNNCTFKGATINGIRIYGKGHRFNNCTFTENAGTGIELISASDIIFDNCYIIKNGGGFKKIKQNSTDTKHEFSGFGVAIRYNSKNIHFNNSKFYLNARDGLNVNQGSHDIYINNCQVFSNDDGGITVASDVVKSGQPGDGKDCYNIFITKTSVSNNYSSGIAVYSPVTNLQITDSKSYNNNRLVGDQTFQSSYINGIYIASGSNKIFIDKTKCYDDRLDYKIEKKVNATFTIKNWIVGKLRERNKVSLYSADGKFKGYLQIISETQGSVTLGELPFNSIAVKQINAGDIVSLKTQHNGVFIDNNCSGSCEVDGFGQRVGAPGANFSGLLVFQGITQSGNTGVAIKGGKVSENLVLNPSFNSNASSWAFNTPGGNSSIDASNAKSGSSLKLVATNQAVFSDCTGFSKNILDNSKGSYLHYGAWVKSNGKASIQLMVSPDQNMSYNYKMDTADGNGKWQYLECWTFVPKSSQGVICRLISDANTVANFDDISLKVVHP